MKATKKALFIGAVVLGVFWVSYLVLAADEGSGHDWQRTRHGRAQGRMHGDWQRTGHGRMMGRMQGRMKMGLGQGGLLGARRGMRQRLDLTDEQAEKLKEIRLSHKDKALAVAERLAKAHRALRDAVKGGDEEKIRKTAAEIGKAIAERAILTSKIQSESRAVLTPEQINKCDAFREARETMQEARQNTMRRLRQRLGKDTEKE